MNKQQEPRLRFKGFTGEWKTEGFESVGEFNPKAEIPQIFQYVDLESVVGTQLISYREEFKETAPSRAQRLAKNGDLFFQAVRPYQKNNYLFEKNNENFVFSTGYIQICPQNDGYFLLTLVQKEEFVQEVLLRCTGTSYPAINTSSLQNIAILIPQTVEEQTHLGLFFRRLDSQIAESRAVLEKSRQLKKAMLAKMFPANGEKIPQIRFKGFEGEWEKVVVGDLGDIVTGNTPTTSDKDNYAEDGLLWVTPTDIKKTITTKTMKSLSEKGKKSARLLPPNSILVTCIASIGKNTLIVEWGSCNQQINALIPKKEFNPYFLFVLSEFWSEKMKKIAGSGTMDIINKTQFSEIETMLPTIKEQTAIGNFFRQLDETIALQAAEVEKLNQLKKGLLAAMLV